MERELRLCKAGLTYHVHSVSRNREFLMKEDEVKDMMIQVLKETQEKFEYELKAFAILDNHFHLFIKTLNELDTISKIMQRIKSVFARRYNKKHGLSGPFWNDRFGSVIEEEQDDSFNYALFLLWYIAYNAVRAGITIDPRDYKYSSIGHYLYEGYKDPFGIKISLHSAFNSLGDTFQKRMKRFLEYEQIYQNYIKKGVRDKMGKGGFF